MVLPGLLSEKSAITDCSSWGPCGQKGDAINMDTSLQGFWLEKGLIASITH